MAKVDLLVVNWNTLDYLINLLDNLHADDDGETWDLYIADNLSPTSDKTWEWYISKGENYRIKHFWQSGINQGYSRAINHLSTKGKSPLLCALNADVWFSTNHVKEMVQSFEDNPNQAICGPKQLDAQGKIKHGGIFWDGVNNPKHRGWDQSDPGDELYKTRDRCWTVSGSIYYVRRQVWDELRNHPGYQELVPNAQGAFLPTPHYFEETFCSVWAQKLGYEVWYDGEVETARHAWHASEPVGESSKKYWATSRAMYKEACEKLGITHELRN